MKQAQDGHRTFHRDGQDPRSSRLAHQSTAPIPSFEVMGPEAANAFLQQVVFHYTPKHASWLNMAEIEIGILDRQCPDRRIQDRATLSAEVAAWQHRRNAERRGINWTFTRQDADTKLGRHYVS